MQVSEVKVKFSFSVFPFLTNITVVIYIKTVIQHELLCCVAILCAVFNFVSKATKGNKCTFLSRQHIK